MQPVSELERPAPRHDALRLLIVEDEISTVFAMREFFSYSGYRVDCAAGPNDAVTLLERNEYDVVITDLHLTPNRQSEGLTVVGCGRARSPQALIVMLTAFTSERTECEACGRGVDLYQTKPVGLADLAARIEAARQRKSPRTWTGDKWEWGGAWPQ
jgi:DNA-binding response OmpR family regulator